MLKLSYYNFYIPVEGENVYLIYNSFKNALFKVDASLGSTLKNTGPELIKLSGPLKQHADALLEEGFLVDESKNEQETVHQIKHRLVRNIRQKSKQIGLTLLVTNNCNLNCSYCFEGKKKPKCIMEESTFQKVLDFVRWKKENEDITSLSLSWYGGEPLLCPDLIRNYAEKMNIFCAESGMKVSSGIITNGVNLNKKNMNLLQEAGVKRIQITVDGKKHIHDRRRPFIHSKQSSYDRIMSNLETVAGVMPIDIRINVDKDVYPGIPELFNDLINRKIWPHHKSIKLYLGYTCATKEFQSETLFSNETFAQSVTEFRKLKLKLYNDWAKENHLPPAKLKLLYPKITNNFCGTYCGANSFVIDADGNISKCWEHVNNANVLIGNVHQGFMEAIKSEQSQKIERNRAIPKKCLKCKVLPVCEAQFCPNDHFELVPNKCSFWKYQLSETLKEQYLMQTAHPEMIESFETVEKRYNSGELAGFEI